LRAYSRTVKVRVVDPATLSVTLQLTPRIDLLPVRAVVQSQRNRSTTPDSETAAH